MNFTKEELEPMKQFSEKNPGDKIIKSILNKMQGTTCIESLIQEIIEMASETHPGNPNEFIVSSKYDGSDMALFLTQIASGIIPLSDFDFNIDIDCKSYDITKEKIENLREQFIKCVCEKNPTLSHVLIYKLSQNLTSESCDAIEKICKKHNTQLMMPVHSYDNNKYIYQNVHISEILRSCSLSFHKLYSGNYRMLDGFTGELISCFDDNGDSD